MPRPCNCQTPFILATYVTAAIHADQGSGLVRLSPAEMQAVFQMPYSTAWRCLKQAGLEKSLQADEAISRVCQFLGVTKSGLRDFVAHNVKPLSRKIVERRLEVIQTHLDVLNPRYKHQRLSKEEQKKVRPIQRRSAR